MKARIIIGFVAIGLLLALALTGCMLGPLTIDARISRFISDLNTADRLNVYQNFSPTETIQYGFITPGSYWETPFPLPSAGDPDYSVTITDSSDPLNVLVTISGGPVTFIGPKDFKLVMVSEATVAGGTNWLIHELYVWNGGWDVLIQ